ncbi:MAG: hotdog fold thioesterase [Kocuria sp.]|nr:hotdog fold thioesterase [Kocuria sp.]
MSESQQPSRHTHEDPTAADVSRSLQDDPVAALNNNRSGQLDARLGVTYVEASTQRVVARMPVEGNRQPMGLLHGGATIALCESVASVGAFLHAASSGRVAVGMDVNATHHTSTMSGYVTATCTPIKLGRSVTSHEVVVLDDSDRRICTARITCFIK